MKDQVELLPPQPGSECLCGELPVLVAGWEYDRNRTCAWCFSGGRVPRWLHGVWVRDAYLEGDDRRRLELFFLVFRQAAGRRRPDLDVRSHDEAVELWSHLTDEQMRWDQGTVQAWSLLMLNPALTVHDARAHLEAGGGTFSRAAALSPVHLVVVEPTGLDALEREARRLGRLVDVIDDRGGLPLPAEPALSPDESRRASLTQKGRWTAEAWSHQVIGSSRHVVRHALALRGAPGITDTQVLEQRLSVKVLVGRLLVCDAPTDVRPALAIWHCDRLRAAHAGGNLAQALDLLPDEHEVLTMAEQLLEPPAG